MSKKKHTPETAIESFKLYLVAILSGKLEPLLQDEERAEVLRFTTIEANRYARYVAGTASPLDIAWIRGHEGDLVGAKALVDAKELEAADAS